MSYFINFSDIFARMKDIFYEQYNVDNVFQNDLNAIYSRINFVEWREERRRFFPS